MSQRHFGVQEDLPSVFAMVMKLTSIAGTSEDTPAPTALSYYLKRVCGPFLIIWGYVRRNWREERLKL